MRVNCGLQGLRMQLRSQLEITEFFRHLRLKIKSFQVQSVELHGQKLVIIWFFLVFCWFSLLVFALNNVLRRNRGDALQRGSAGLYHWHCSRLDGRWWIHNRLCFRDQLAANDRYVPVSIGGASRVSCRFSGDVVPGSWSREAAKARWTAGAALAQLLDQAHGGLLQALGPDRIHYIFQLLVGPARLEAQ